MVDLNSIEVVTVESHSTDQLRIQQNEGFGIEQKSSFLSIRDIVNRHDVKCGFNSGYKISFIMKNDYRIKTAVNKISYVIGKTNEL